MMAKRERLSLFASLKMGQFTRENGLQRKIRRTVEVYRFGLMAPGMTVSGETEWPMDMVD